MSSSSKKTRKTQIPNQKVDKDTKTNKIAGTDEDQELERLAIQELLKDSKRASEIGSFKKRKLDIGAHRILSQAVISTLPRKQSINSIANRNRSCNTSTSNPVSSSKSNAKVPESKSNKESSSSSSRS